MDPLHQWGDGRIERQLMTEDISNEVKKTIGKCFLGLVIFIMIPTFVICQFFVGYDYDGTTPLVLIVIGLSTLSLFVWFCLSAFFVVKAAKSGTTK